MPSSGTFSAGRSFECCMGAAFSCRRRRLDGQCSDIPDCIGQRQEVVRTRLLRSCWHGEAQNFPAPWHGEGIRMLPAQVIAMGFGVGGQRTQDCGGVRIDVRQGSHR